MKKNKNFIIALSLLFCTSAFAQVSVDHAIQLTGAGVNAKLNGIRSVTDSLDATSAQVVQNGSLIYAVATGSNNNFSITISPPVPAYQAGMVFNFISNQTINGPTTLNVNGLGAKPIKKSIQQDMQGCEIQNGQFVTVAYDGTNFQMTSVFAGLLPTTASAGPDQLYQSDTVVTLAANEAVSGTGMWNVVSGTGGSFSNPYSPVSAFTGHPGASYMLSWTITSCISSSDSVNVSFISHGSQTFSYTGGQQAFTVPMGITQVSFNLYGAQGGTGALGTGGLGGETLATISVTPGSILYIYVGGQPGSYNGGFNGGGSGYGSNGAGGGGATDIRTGGTGVSNRIIVAGGGGGGANLWASNGGAGGGLTGGDASGANCPAHCGDGATQSAGGAGETGYGEGGETGSFGYGGNSGGDNNGGGGGGGGYYGGGAGNAGAGGGGSAYVIAGGSSAITYNTGVQSGNGQIIFSW